MVLDTSRSPSTLHGRCPWCRTVGCACDVCEWQWTDGRRPVEARGSGGAAERAARAGHDGARSAGHRARTLRGIPLLTASSSGSRVADRNTTCRALRQARRVVLGAMTRDDMAGRQGGMDAMKVSILVPRVSECRRRVLGWAGWVSRTDLAGCRGCARMQR